MLKFFRSIRKSLLFRDKTLRYFQYAIGEIILVVIGILIALQINNWNEERKIRVKTKAVMQEVLRDLEYSSKIADQAIAIYEEKDSLLNRVLNGDATAEDFRNNRQYRALFTKGFNMAVTKNGFDKLIAMSGDLKGDYNVMLAQLKLHYGYSSDIMIDNYNNVIDLSRGIIKHYSETYPWFSSFSRNPDEEYINYCMNDPLFKNEIRLMQIASINGYLNRIYYYRFSAIRSYQILYEELGLDAPVPEHLRYLKFPEAETVDRIKGSYHLNSEDGRIDPVGTDNNYLPTFMEGGVENYFMQITGQELEFEDLRGRRLKFETGENNVVESLVVLKDGKVIGRWVKE